MDDARTVFVGNLDEQVTEELLYELFLQAGPLERVKIHTDKEGRKSNFGFVTFKHEVSVPYTIELFCRIKLFDRNLNIKPRNGGAQQHKSAQRSLSFPSDGFNQEQRNEQMRFDDRNEVGPQHISYEDLLNMGQMLSVGYNYSQDSYNLGGSDISSGHSRQYHNRGNYNHEEERRGNDYSSSDNKKNNYHGKRNDNRRNQYNRKNTYDRNRGRRNNRY